MKQAYRLDEITHQENLRFDFEPKEPDLPYLIEVRAQCATYDDSFDAIGAGGWLQTFEDKHHEVLSLELYRNNKNITKTVLEVAPWVFSEAEDLALEHYEQLIHEEF